MTYLPTELLTVVDACNIKSVAIGRTADEISPWYLFTGGIHPMIVHLTGEYAGKGFELNSFNSKPMLLFDEVEFEVDRNSLFRSAAIQEPIGALLLSGLATGIIVQRTDRTGFSEAITVYFNDPHDGSCSSNIEEFGFKNWRAVKRFGDQIFEVLKYQSTEMADR